ncbi:MAG TPA: hypothetical protein VG456_12980 [Candidatus Sulfopaludibacter sp.]|jgi:hypothetical protein|nr:hypothetical protein [Candidatus Sulfopaludibacter sp.]
MRSLVGFAVVLFAASSVFAQRYVNPTPVVVGGVGSAVFPAGTAATNPGIQRFTPNVIHPGGGGPRLVVPNATLKARPARGNNGNSFVYGYPVYVGGSYGSVYDSSAEQPAPPQQQPGVTIIMPPQAPPVIINQYDAPAHPQMSVYQPETAPAAEEPAAAEPTRYLLAFKDHTIYSAIAYWVDGDTLHYFTAGNTHNQVSVSLVDRGVTERLNREAGVEVKLPAAKE